MLFHKMEIILQLLEWINTIPFKLQIGKIKIFMHLDTLLSTRFLISFLTHSTVMKSQLAVHIM